MTTNLPVMEFSLDDEEYMFFYSTLMHTLSMGSASKPHPHTTTNSTTTTGSVIGTAAGIIKGAIAKSFTFIINATIYSA